MSAEEYANFFSLPLSPIVFSFFFAARIIPLVHCYHHLRLEWFSRIPTLVQLREKYRQRRLGGRGEDARDGKGRRESTINLATRRSIALSPPGGRVIWWKREKLWQRFSKRAARIPFIRSAVIDT